MANTFEKSLTVESLYHLSFFFQDDSGYINFREYLIGLALVSQPANSEEAMQLAFQVGNYTGHWQGCYLSENGHSGNNTSGPGFLFWVRENLTFQGSKLTFQSTCKVWVVRFFPLANWQDHKQILSKCSGEDDSNSHTFSSGYFAHSQRIKITRILRVCKR